MDNITEQECRTCHKILPVTDFYVRRTNKHGIDTKCKICDNIASKAWAKKKREKYGKRVKCSTKYTDIQYRQVNRAIVAKSLLLYRKRFQILKKAGIEVDLPFAATDNELTENNTLIDKTLEAHGLGDARAGRSDKFQQMYTDNDMPGMQEA
jgi:hypothetical protein